jgi:hypothetical protein
MKRDRPARRTILFAFLALALSAVSLAAQEAPSPAGHWEGAIVAPNGNLEFNVDLAQDEEGAWTGDISIPVQMLADFALGEVKVEGSKVSFLMPGVPGDPTFVGTLSEDGKTIAGTFTQGPAELEFSMTRKDPQEP